LERLSWFLNKVWNLGHNNEDADFDWWEWYGPHLVKRFWKRTMGRYIKELAESPLSIVSLGCGSSPVITLFHSRVVGIEIDKGKVRKRAALIKLFTSMKFGSFLLYIKYGYKF